MAKKSSKQNPASIAVRKLKAMKDLPVVSNPHIPLTWADAIRVQRRQDQPVITITFLSIVNDSLVESGRFQVSIEHFLRMHALFAKVGDEIATQLKAIEAEARKKLESKKGVL